ncbi:hypothetical protein Tco_0727873 [Tanacetum coccineum]|uniref:Uncharacterized protein n=1 Tax=Tanacetum coccineum TaxID=301880 RepID=A0ABQ4YM28_9ASTR
MVSWELLEKEGYTLNNAKSRAKYKLISGSIGLILSGNHEGIIAYSSLDGMQWHGVWKMQGTVWQGKSIGGISGRSPSRAIEKKTPMEMWLGHPSDYGMLRIFSLCRYPPRYKSRLDGESPKIVTSRNVVFNESFMYKDTLKDSGAGDKSVEELHVEVELQRLNNNTQWKIRKMIRKMARMRMQGIKKNRPSATGYHRLSVGRDGFSDGEQEMGVSRSFQWAKASELQMGYSR